MPRSQSKSTEEYAARDARYGEKMIEVKVRFWTDGLTGVDGQIIPKNGITGGVVRMKRNESHGIVPTKAIVFNSLLEIGAAIEKCLLDNAVVLHPSARTKRYLVQGDSTD